ncbi:LysR family transcriptional regulator [Bdellovibrio sp. BCCA]|uniref:LysR family transcriptional regulator n=1 Tax=Bdellovibrio sp. BCCA TaxID=3136281 RepID=UPI0030F219FD
MRNFVEMALCETIVQCANKLEISQPALSESLKRLEHDLGCTLFYRSRSGIQLTPTGKIMLNKAQTALRALSDLDIATDKENIFAGRTIIIGCHATVAQYSIPKALKHLKSVAPDYKIELRHDLSRNIQSEIQKGTIDVGIVINPVRVPDLVITPIATDVVGVWAHKSSKNLDTIICNPDLFQTQSILKKWKDKPRNIISTESLELICRLVNEEIGFGILPERAVHLFSGPLKQLEKLPVYKDEIALVYRPEFGKVPSERLTIEALGKGLMNS